jgi:hypothetical protein
LAPDGEGVILESDEEEDGGCCVAFRDHGSCRLGDQCRYSHDSATNATSSAEDVVDPYADLVAVEAIGSSDDEEEEEGEDTGGGHKGKRKGALTTVQSLYEYTGPQPHYGFDPERLALNTAFTNKGKRVPADLWAQMYPFQQQGVAFGVQRHGRVLIADEMGLGKSISAIATATVYLKDWPLLVLCPGSLRKNWELEFRHWVYDILIVGRTKMTPLGSKMSIEVVLDGKAKLSPDMKVTIMSYDLADVYREQLQEMRYKVIICDESHYLKSPTAKRTRLLMPLLHGARRLLMLTGTPALSRPSELFTQLHALAPKAFPSLKSFCDDFCQPSSNLGRLHEQVKAVMLRRLKIDVLSLPSKIRTVTTVESGLSAAGSLSRRELCDGLSSLVKGRDPKAQESPATHFIHQYQRAGVSKLPAVKKYVRALAMKLPPTEKLLVFAHHQVLPLPLFLAHRLLVLISCSLGHTGCAGWNVLRTARLRRRSVFSVDHTYKTHTHTHTHTHAHARSRHGDGPYRWAGVCTFLPLPQPSLLTPCRPKPEHCARRCPPSSDTFAYSASRCRAYCLVWELECS